jgi:hypothetical protein
MGLSMKLSWNFDLSSDLGDTGLIGVKNTLTSPSLEREDASDFLSVLNKGCCGFGEVIEELEMVGSSAAPVDDCLDERPPTPASGLASLFVDLDMDRPRPCEAPRTGIGGLSKS